MRRKIRDTSDCITLYLYIWAKHLTNKGFQSTKFDNKKFVVGFREKYSQDQFEKDQDKPTVNGEVAESRTGSPLNFSVMAAE